MNTDRSSSTRTRRVQARYIATYNHNVIAANNSGLPTFKYAANNPDASLITYINEGNLEAPPVTAIPQVSTPTQAGSAFIPTTWIDAAGTDFSDGGRSVAFGQDVWVAVGADSDYTIKRSTDNALTWVDIDNQMPLTGGESANAVATDGNGKWVVVGSKNTAAGAITILFSSDNGLTWNSNSAYDSGFNSHNGTTDRGWGVTYNNGLWVAVGHYGVVGIGYERVVKIATAFDTTTGPNWANSPAGLTDIPVFGVSNPAMCVAYGNGVWCIGGQDFGGASRGSIFYSTNNGSSWTKSTNSFNGQCYGIATDGNGNWIAVGMKYNDAKPIKYSSDNGITWIDTPAADESIFSTGNDVTYSVTSAGVGIWVATGDGNSQTIIYSLDNGLSWTSAGTNTFTFGGNGIHFANDRWVAVGDGGSSSIKYSLA